MKTGAHSKDKLPGFSTFADSDLVQTPGTVTFSPSDVRADLPIRDSAELEIKDVIADRGKVVAGIRPIPMRTGRCVAFTVASDTACRTQRTENCALNYFLGHCDSPDDKRYLFIGDFGATASVDRRPPDFAKNAANFERILRSIEFKKS